MDFLVLLFEETLWDKAGLSMNLPQQLNIVKVLCELRDQSWDWPAAVKMLTPKHTWTEKDMWHMRPQYDNDYEVFQKSFPDADLTRLISGIWDT